MTRTRKLLSNVYRDNHNYYEMVRVCSIKFNICRWKHIDQIEHNQSSQYTYNLYVNKSTKISDKIRSDIIQNFEYYAKCTTLIQINVKIKIL